MFINGNVLAPINWTVEDLATRGLLRKHLFADLNMSQTGSRLPVWDGRFVTGRMSRTDFVPADLSIRLIS